MANGLSLRAYARHRKADGLAGGNISAVQKAVASGRIATDGAGKIDPVRADRDWERNTAASDLSGVTTSGGRVVTSGGRVVTSDFNTARAAKETHTARLRELDVQEREGHLLDAEAVEREWSAHIHAVRAKLLGMPTKLAAELADLSEPARVRSVLEREIHEALAELASEWGADPDATDSDGAGDPEVGAAATTDSQ